jgi:hypothetical protein
MTPEERFERIERDLAAAAALSVRNEQAIQGLHGHIAALADATKLLGDRVAEYVAASDARMRQMEANLDALIRIITAEHSNGRRKLGE